jgi:hypothetical protein
LFGTDFITTHSSGKKKKPTGGGDDDDDEGGDEPPVIQIAGQSVTVNSESRFIQNSSGCPQSFGNSSL